MSLGTEPAHQRLKDGTVGLGSVSAHDAATNDLLPMGTQTADRWAMTGRPLMFRPGFSGGSVVPLRRKSERVYGGSGWFRTRPEEPCRYSDERRPSPLKLRPTRTESERQASDSRSTIGHGKGSRRRQQGNTFFVLLTLDRERVVHALEAHRLPRVCARCRTDL